MKKYISIFVKHFGFLTIAFLFTGCLKDTCHHTKSYTWFQPLYKTSAEVRANIKSNAPKEIQSPGKIFIIGNYIFLNEINKGIHVIDNRNPAAPVNVAFIDIPGNIDLAIKGHTLYADLYTDLVTIDISDPLNIVKKNITDGVFPARYYEGYNTNNGDSNKIIYDWIKHDTTVTEDCQTLPPAIFPGVYYATDNLQSAIGKSNSPLGTGGSMARFALINNYLYTVGDNDLNVFNVTNGDQPAFTGSVQVDWHVETIYPFENKLFVGSNNGMIMYDVQSSASAPKKIGEFTHARACDPVIADDKYAYITLHSGTECLGYNNQLDVVQLNNFTDASLVKTYNLTSPHGLSKDGNLLFICDGTDGLKVFNASDANNIKLLKQIPGAETYDVIAYNKLAIVVASDGLYQYNYSDINNIHLLSKILISK